jgi:hypothetical protein
MRWLPNNPPSLYHGWLAGQLTFVIVMVNEAHTYSVPVVVTSMSKYGWNNFGISNHRLYGSCLPGIWKKSVTVEQTKTHTVFIFYFLDQKWNQSEVELEIQFSFSSEITYCH